MNTYIGIDLGGTKLLVGEVTEAGEVLHSRSYPTGALTQQQAMDLICSALDAFLPECSPAVQAIGLGLVGRIDSEKGLWLEISGGRKATLPICEMLSQRYSLPAFADNDVRSALKAELRFGQGRGIKDLIYINVGTGVAAGFVTGGHIVTGGHCNAGEIGHTSSGLSFRISCECGRDDCVESVISGLGLSNCARLLAPEYPDTRLTIPADGGRASAAEIFRLSDTDPLCHRLTEQAAKALSNLLMNLVRFNDPQAIILGGGVVSDGFLLKKALGYTQAHPLRYVTAGIHLTTLDPRTIGLLGAASNAIIGMEETI